MPFWTSFTQAIAVGTVTSWATGQFFFRGMNTKMTDVVLQKKDRPELEIVSFHNLFINIQSILGGLSRLTSGCEN